jgi:hypothetical protein
LDFFLLRPAKGLALALGTIACGGCTLDFDRFTPLGGSSQEAGTGPDLEGGAVEDVATTSPDDASTGVEAGAITDANQGGPRDATADGTACSETRGVLFGGHCYFPLAARGSWMAASTSCQAVGAHLATIGSAEEQTAVAAIQPNQDRWIGLSRPAASLPVATSYAWITAEPASYAHWGNGEPNFTGECVRIMQGATWADNPCTTNYYALCERE